MKHLKLHTPDFTDENIARIAELFPNCVTEAEGDDGSLKYAIDFDQLRQELSSEIVEGPRERYRLDWPGKREALLTANAPIAKTLRPCKEESVDFDTTKNLYIEGDNLDALKLLQETYLNKVKMIYIDPPYNTGNDFVYNDDFKESSEEYFERSNQSDEDGNRLVANTDSNGRFHSDWLTMMYPRLKLARNLLKDDGVIFISIDDNEVHNLRKMCDEIFGAENFVAVLVWERAYAPKNDAKYISNSHDYVVMYAKSIDRFQIGRLPRTEKANARYKNPDNDPRGVWKSSDMSVKTYNEKCDYPITTPSGRVVEPPTGRCWRLSKKAFLERLNDNRIYFGKDGNSVPCIKRFITELKFDGMAPQSIMFYKDVGHSQEGAKEVTALLEVGAFDGPKPLRLLSRMLTLSRLQKSDIILDFFSGSATTAHAVMQLNAEDGGKRQHIMVQLPEPCDEKSAAAKAGFTTIAEIGKERIRRAGKKILEEWKQKQADNDAQPELLDTENSKLKTPATPPDIGFRVLKVDTSNMADVYYHPDQIDQDQLAGMEENIKPGRSPEDLLFQVLLDWGVELTLPIAQHTLETTNAKGKPYTVFTVDGNALLACLDEDISEEAVKEMATLQPLRAVFRDSSFTTDSTKINIEQIFKLLSPHTELRTI